MIHRLRKFAECENGNIMFMTAAFALPALALIGGAYELSEFTRIKKNLQSSADTAVIAAFHKPRENWGKRKKRVNQLFKANLITQESLNSLKTSLSYQTRGNTIVMKYTVKTGVNSLFGDVSPFSASNFKVESVAEFNPTTQRSPRLISNPDATATLQHW